MSPEQRAEQIVDAVFLSGSKWGEHDWGFAKTIIATAIREAEDAAYERAAARCEEFAAAQMTPPITGYIEGRHDAGQALSAHIIALKSQEP